jgi:hypothetical protein
MKTLFDKTSIGSLHLRNRQYAYPAMPAGNSRMAISAPSVKTRSGIRAVLNKPSGKPS